MERCSKEEFIKHVEEAGRALAQATWERLHEKDAALDGIDGWMRAQGGAFLRRLLGAALTARAESIGVSGDCDCGGRFVRRQHKPFTLHTMLPGRDVDITTLYGQCDRCRRGVFPILEELKCDAKGYSAELRDLALRAATMEPYLTASQELLEAFAGVAVSHEKLQSLVAEEGPEAATFMAREQPAPATAATPPGPVYVGIDGGMIHVDGAWQEVKLFCGFRAEDHVESSPSRGQLAVREVAAVRGPPEALGAILDKRVPALAGDSTVVVLGDGAPWIWNLADLHIPNRTEILDWFHAKEHVAKAARVVYGEGPKADRWRELQLARLWDDGIDDVLSGLRFLIPKQRSRTKRAELENLSSYLTKNRSRMFYKTFRDAGLRIGSGFIESAVAHVVQQRMKRTGMHWSADGADRMLALRSLLRSTGAWGAFRRSRRAAA
jgi:hypothetical protein